MSPSRLFQIAAETSDLVRALPHRLDVFTQKLVADDFAGIVGLWMVATIPISDRRSRKRKGKS